MSNMATQNFKDILQVCVRNPIVFHELILLKCSIPVFDGLLPNDHNKVIMNLLFIMAHWHALVKLCMHSDLTHEILNQ